jgi:hypothetical protein
MLESPFRDKHFSLFGHMKKGFVNVVPELQSGFRFWQVSALKLGMLCPSASETFEGLLKDKQYK